MSDRRRRKPDEKIDNELRNDVGGG